MMPKKLTTWANLAAEKTVTVAVDTEYQGTETLTSQSVTRVGDVVYVQLYHSPSIPPPPQGCFGKAFTDRFPARVVVRPPKVITPDLSPAQVLTDLMGLSPSKFLTRYEGDSRRPSRYDTHAKQNGRRESRQLPRVNVILVAHFLPADLLRAFGRNFYSGLLAPSDVSPAVALRDGRVIGFSGTGGIADVYADPVVEYVEDSGDLYEVQLGTMDTNRVCGSTKLDDLARTYLEVAKDESITAEDKARMKAVFLDPARTADAYRYAAQDAVLTLLIAERMRKQHEALYADFDIPADSVPPMHGTPGMQVSNFMLQHARHTAAAGSARLGAASPTAPAGLNKLKELARRGSAAALSDGRVSHYGLQTGDTHGGLLQSRTPFQFFHSAEGQFRDLDLKSCYPAIIRPMVSYLGRPVVFEPGHETWTMRRAAKYLKKHADSDYAWFVKVSGRIQGFVNTLIPSTVDALTNDNYKDRDRDRAVRKANVALLARKKGEWLREEVADRKYTSLLTDEVNAGVVTWATWLMIQALPRDAREQYEHLRAETVVFYPKKFAAGTGAEFDALVAKYRTDHAVSWKQELDLDGMTLTNTEDLDERFVSLRYPVGQLTDGLIKKREEAGKDTAAGLLFKTLANTAYGVFASPFLPTSNPVTGNVITGTARALAYAMTHSLNSLLVITDGVLYRRDRIPADTFAGRVRHAADYPLLHADAGSFVDPADIPGDDAGFTDWYVGHVLRFFGVGGRHEYESLFRLHTLVHKELPGAGGVAFDGIYVDGSANYAKLLRTPGKWRVADLKARSFGHDQKRKLKSWLGHVYSTDNFTEPPPATVSHRPLGVRDALVQASKALAAQPSGSVVVPLGLWQPTLSTYKLIKPSAFVFRTARQRAKVLKDWARLTMKTQCGPELLALRRTYGGRLAAVAKKLFELIREGHERLNTLNIDKLWRPGSVGLSHGDNVDEGRHEERQNFLETLSVMPSNQRPLTGLIVNRQSLTSVRQASNLVE